MKQVTVCILIDALRYDFVTHEDSPVLQSLRGQNSIQGVIEEPFGFIGRPATFAGLYPEVSNISSMYWYEPQKSPYGIAKYIPSFLDGRPLFSKYIRRVTTAYANIVHGNKERCYSFDTYNVPLHLLPYFNLVEQIAPWNPRYLSQITLFDIFRENNVKWLFIGYPGSDQRTRAIWDKFQREISPDISFVWLHFAETDWAEHEYGPMSKERKEKLREIDATIAKVRDELEKMFSQVHMLVFGDHGAVEVKETIDIKGRLESLNLRVGKDYVYFLDSTMARFWFKNDIARLWITEAMSSLLKGKLLTEDDFVKYRAHFNHTRYGELIWVANEGVLILPNFWQGGSPVKGMHGYLPDVKDNQAAFLLSSPVLDKPVELKSPCDMVDIFPTILDLMDLPIPETNEGTSILARAKEA
jgi:predicted AlkP superfamily pyrophosphatase or phosphodiesterase